MELIEKRRVGRPKTTTVGIAERIERYQLMEKCASLTDECIALWSSMISNPNCPWVLRLEAADRLMDRAYGKPPQAMMMDAASQETSLKKVVHEVRWLPPDPNDRSVVTIPEPD
jgi:hypothetical protein